LDCGLRFIVIALDWLRVVRCFKLACGEYAVPARPLTRPRLPLETAGRWRLLKIITSASVAWSPFRNLVRQGDFLFCGSLGSCRQLL
jgi:hypothetical protein